MYLPVFVAINTLLLLLFFSILFFVKNDVHAPSLSVNSNILTHKILDDLFGGNKGDEALYFSTGFSQHCFIQAGYLRPDETRNGRYLVMSQEVKFVEFDKMFYCKSMGDKLIFSETLDSFKVKLQLEGDLVIAYVYCSLQGKDRLVDRQELSVQKQEISDQLASVYHSLDKAKIYRQDCLFSHYGGSIFQSRKAKMRLLMEDKIFYLGENDTLSYENKTFMATSDVKDKITVCVKFHSKGACFYLFNATGDEAVEMSKTFEPIKPFFNASFISMLQVVNSNMVTCSIFNKKMTIEQGDWIFIHRNQKIFPLKNFQEIQQCINALLPGSLVIVDQIKKTNNHDYVIVGHFFDETRQSMSVIRQTCKARG